MPLNSIPVRLAQVLVDHNQVDALAIDVFVVNAVAAGRDDFLQVFVFRGSLEILDDLRKVTVVVELREALHAHHVLHDKDQGSVVPEMLGDRPERLEGLFFLRSLKVRLNLFVLSTVNSLQLGPTLWFFFVRLVGLHRANRAHRRRAAAVTEAPTVWAPARSEEADSSKSGTPAPSRPLELIAMCRPLSD